MDNKITDYRPSWMFSRPLDSDVANAIYSVLVEEAGAYNRADDRASFVYSQSRGHIAEWRFCGALGFGGKFWNNAGRWSVTCYREDETPEILQMIEKTNERLEELRQSFLAKHDDSGNPLK